MLALPCLINFNETSLLSIVHTIRGNDFNYDHSILENEPIEHINNIILDDVTNVAVIAKENLDYVISSKLMKTTLSIAVIGTFAYFNPVDSFIQFSTLFMSGAIAEALQHNQIWIAENIGIDKDTIRNIAEFIAANRWYINGVAVGVNASKNILVNLIDSQNLFIKPLGCIMSVAFNHAYSEIIKLFNQNYDHEIISSIATKGQKNSFVESALDFSFKIALKELNKQAFEFEDMVLVPVAQIYGPNLKPIIINLFYPFYIAMIRGQANEIAKYLFTDGPSNEKMEETRDYAFDFSKYTIAAQTKELLNAIHDDHPYLHASIPAFVKVVIENINRKTAI
jgi:hypothetical protein